MCMVEKNARAFYDGIKRRRCQMALVMNDTDMKLSLIHISEPTRQAEISYAVFCLKKKNQKKNKKDTTGLAR